MLTTPAGEVLPGMASAPLWHKSARRLARELSHLLHPANERPMPLTALASDHQRTV
jgi:hypothetical protein